MKSFEIRGKFVDEFCQRMLKKYRLKRHNVREFVERFKRYHKGKKFYMAIDRDSYSCEERRYYFIVIIDNNDMELRLLNDGYFPCKDWVFWDD